MYAKKFKNYFQKKSIKIRWRKINGHNSTNALTIFNVDSVQVGNRSYGDLNILQFDQNATLKIGSNVSSAPCVHFLLGGEHDYSRISTWPYQSLIYKQKSNWTSYETVVEDDVWIGYGSTILTGVKIGKGSVIGAKSVVAKDIPPFSVYVGNKVIKKRFSSAIIEKLNNINFENIYHKKGDDYEQFCTLSLNEENIDSIIAAFTNRF
ncbi:CatB-related O-acetyltransferase [Streptococcus infantarius]|uniref:CatB-related O-acetyltransferase n=1 Tax=Streptococcus infantarius TaxID=102684 RepID=UPI0022DEF101|nr:CatB-related O-acetyltransferase [Streptococcus infantarius]